jgi:hypothetical protein
MSSLTPPEELQDKPFGPYNAKVSESLEIKREGGFTEMLGEVTSQS